MVSCVTWLGEKYHPIKQGLQTHQRTDSLVKRIFKKNHRYLSQKADDAPKMRAFIQILIGYTTPRVGPTLVCRVPPSWYLPN
jgi:hypothetical protein